MFEWAHLLYVWQALIMLDVLIVWLVWVRTLPRDGDSGHPPPPARQRRRLPHEWRRMVAPLIRRQGLSARALRARRAGVASAHVRCVVFRGTAHPVAGQRCWPSSSPERDSPTSSRRRAKRRDADVRDGAEAGAGDRGRRASASMSTCCYAFGLPLFAGADIGGARNRSASSGSWSDTRACCPQSSGAWWPIF